ncbi:MAG: hypothetical protein GX267_04915 [Fibrobacter sp.]|nr:hypothetical protein [Fibrobacter sp.]
MTYLGIGYSGPDNLFLRDLVNKHIDWLKGDRLPRFFGDAFIVLYDSNTAREFAKKCKEASDDENVIVVYPMDKPV